MRAGHIVEGIRYPSDKGRTLSEMAVVMAKVGAMAKSSEFLSQAREVAGGISDPRMKTEALREIGLAMARVGGVAKDPRVTHRGAADGGKGRVSVY